MGDFSNKGYPALGDHAGAKSPLVLVSWDGNFVVRERA